MGSCYDSHHFVGFNKTIALPKGTAGRWPAIRSRCFFIKKLDLTRLGKENSQHIRPLGVRPLNYPERVQKAWGFPFSGVRS